MFWQEQLSSVLMSSRSYGQSQDASREYTGQQWQTWFKLQQTCTSRHPSMKVVESLECTPSISDMNQCRTCVLCIARRITAVTIV